MNKNVLANVAGIMFIIKDVTVKQITVNVTDIDKSKLSVHKLLEMPTFSMDTRSRSSSPLVNNLVKCLPFKTTPDGDEPPFQFIHTMDLCVVDTMLHASPDVVIHRTEIWAAWRPQVGRKKV